MVDPSPFWAAVAGGAVSAVPAAVVGVRQGRIRERRRRDDELRERVYEAEIELAEIKAAINERRRLRGDDTPYIGPERRKL